MAVSVNYTVSSVFVSALLFSSCVLNVCSCVFAGNCLCVFLQVLAVNPPFFMCAVCYFYRSGLRHGVCQNRDKTALVWD